MFALRYKSVSTHQMTGVYWGAFDPPTIAHEAIIKASLNDIRLKKLIVVINNHSYKEYTNSLENRLKLMSQVIQATGHNNFELTWQDNINKIDFASLRNKTSEPLCAIAGYDSYKKWVAYSRPEDRQQYDAIAVIPRGDEEPALFDEKAFLLPISSTYKDVSSTKVREALKASATSKDLLKVE